MSTVDSAQVACGAFRPLSIIERFNELRQRLLRIVDDGAKLGAVLGSNRELLGPAFEGARRAISLSRLNLVVIGPEGAGKSTLIRAILGTELSPVEDHYPGTVAPVFIEWGQAKRPEYSVMLQSAENPGFKEQDCKEGLQEFKRFLLHHYNNYNEKGVIEGRVRCDQRILSQGLRLVDIPGVEGVSATTDQLARTFIRENGAAVIGVAKGRPGYGPLLRLIDSVLKKTPGESANTWIQGIVLNVDNTFYRSLGSPEALEGEVHVCTDAAMDVFSTEARKRGTRFDLEADKLFVLDLMSVIDLNEGREPVVKAELIRPELERFHATLNQYMSENGMSEVIKRGAAQARRALNDLNDKLGIRRKMLMTLVQGDPAERSRIADQFAKAAGTVRDRWQQYVAPDNIAAIASKYWEDLRPRLLASRDEILTTIHAIENEVQGITERLPEDKATELRTRLEQAVSRNMEQFQAAEAAAFERVLAEFCESANALMKWLFSEVPLLDSGDESVQPVTPEALLQVAVGTMDEGMLDKVGKIGLAIGGGAIGVKLATIYLLTQVGVPGALAVQAGVGSALTALAGAFGVATLWPVALGAAIVGGVGWGLWALLRDGKKAAVLKALKQTREQVQSVDTSDGGKTHAAWTGMVEKLARDVGDFLQQQLRQREELIQIPEKSADMLKRDVATVDGAINRVRELLDTRLSKEVEAELL